MKRFVVVSGLPGSGKSTLAARLAWDTGLPVIDKDVLLEELFGLKGVGDAAWRRELSRQSDLLLREKATISEGAILVSHWHLPGMPADSGTPTDWLLQPSHAVVHVHCVCTPEIAAERFCRRIRHPGHRDQERSHAEILMSIRTVAGFGTLEIGRRIDVDTSLETNVMTVVRYILNLAT